MTGLALDRLDGGAMEVVRLEGARFGGTAPREPHRHDYHELIWVREGRGQHSIDGVTLPVRRLTVTVIGRGQVHVFERGEDLHGERWYEASRTERREADDAEVQLHRRFTRRLEEDFAHHHDAAHYADALGVPAAARSRALAHVTGRATKDLITERVMLEAARLLRFTNLAVSEVAHRVGFVDPLYYSRAFKRRHDASPQAYRDRARGKSKHA